MHTALMVFWDVHCHTEVSLIRGLSKWEVHRGPEAAYHDEALASGSLQADPEVVQPCQLLGGLGAVAAHGRKRLPPSMQPQTCPH